jgi:myo-inositol-1(or 4)-monophosphatase
MIEELKQIVTQAGDIALSYRGSLSETSIEYKNPVDLVTKVDREIEDFIRDKVATIKPGAAFFGEETADAELASLQQVFICDPLDGTTNFVHGHPFFCISLAYREEHTTRYGIIYLPAFGTLYHAEKGKGSFRDNQAIHVSSTDTLINVLAGTGFACVRARKKQDNVPVFSHMVYKTRGIRRDGAAAIDLAYVAEGIFDLFWELNLHPWDTAAGALLVEEAGGKVTDIDGSGEYEKNNHIVASNGLIHEQFLQELRVCCHEPPLERR